MRTFFLLFVVVALLPLVAMAQLPQDEAIRIGKLKNGLTYYIRHNDKDAGLADFYIAQRVGSILEEPRQRGLAHFLEHMAFNGTKHFPNKGKQLGIVPWCETIGVKFGANLNAYTSVDQTVYHVGDVPVSREGIVDSCLLILNDWSHYILLEDREIDKERGVIHEEWRNRRSGMASQRLIENAMPTIYKGTKYEDCLPIGSMDIVDNFPYSDLRDYYHKWYRPDLQGIIIVGDIDVDKMEKKIKRLFSKIPMPRDAAERIYYPVTDNDNMIVAIEKDKEQPIPLIDIYMKHDITPDAQKNTVNYLRESYVGALVVSMLNARLSEQRQQANPPYMSASSRNGAFFVSKTKGAFSVSVSCKTGNVLGGLMTALAIVEQARQHGFTIGELERAKKLSLTAAQRRYAERNERHNSHYVNKCINHFLQGEPLLSAEFELEVAQKHADEVTLSEVNEAVQNMVTNKNQVVTLYAPDKENQILPTADMLEQVVLTMQKQRYAPYIDDVLPTDLLAQQPQPGNIVSEKVHKHGFTEFVLSNGMKVYFKHTTNTADGVRISIKGEGGTSLYSDDDIPNFTLVNSAVTEGGVGSFDAVTLRKMLAGKAVKVSPMVSSNEQSVNAGGSVKDIRTMFELIYLYFTQPRRDTIAFEGLMNRTRAFLINRNASPKVIYNDSVQNIMYGNHKRMQPVTSEVLSQASYDRILSIYKERFADASNFKAVIIGNVSADSLRSFLCQYLASLSSTYKGETTNYANIPQLVTTSSVHRFVREQATPIAHVGHYISADIPFSAQADLELDFLTRVLQIAYTDSVREEKGGTYGVSVGFNLNKDVHPSAMVAINYKCDPLRYTELNEVVCRQLELIAQNGPAQSSIDKVKQFLLKQYTQLQKEDDYWNYVMWHELDDETDFDNNYDQMVQNMTAEQVQRMAQNIVNAKQHVEVTMLSE